MKLWANNMKQLSKTVTFNCDVYSVTATITPCEACYNSKGYQYSIDSIIYTECGSDAYGEITLREWAAIEKCIDEVYDPFGQDDCYI